jgi:hypothetical protein
MLQQNEGKYSTDLFDICYGVLHRHLQGKGDITIGVSQISPYPVDSSPFPHGNYHSG